MGYAQELDRRMKGFSNFAISFSIICILAGGITTYPVALSSGGPFSVTIGWVIGGVFALVVAASLGQIARPIRPPAASITGRRSSADAAGAGSRPGSTCSACSSSWPRSISASFCSSAISSSPACFGMDVSGWTSAAIGDHGWWVQSIVITLITISQALFNHFGIRTTTVLTDFSGYLIFVVAIILTIAMLAYAPSWDLSQALRLHQQHRRCRRRGRARSAQRLRRRS